MPTGELTGTPLISVQAQIEQIEAALEEAMKNIDSVMRDDSVDKDGPVEGGVDAALHRVSVLSNRLVDRTAHLHDRIGTL